MNKRTKINYPFDSDGCVYRAESPSGKCYIGITMDFKRRFSRHKSAARYRSNKFYLAIKKYGWDNFKWDILFESKDKEKLKEMEMFFINKYNSFRYGYNMTLGGDGLHGVRNFGRKMSYESLYKSSSSKCKPINVFKRETLEFVGTWQMRSDCQKELGIKSISAVLNEKSSSKAIHGYYITTDGIEFVLANKDIISHRINTRKKEVRPKWNKGISSSDKHRENIAIAFNNEKYSIKYLFSNTEKTTSSISNIERITGINRRIFKDKINQNNPLYYNEFKITKI